MRGWFYPCRNYFGLLVPFEGGRPNVLSMISLEAYWAYVVAASLLIAIPGANVTLILANSLTNGTRAGLLTVAGTEAGAAILLTALILGISPIMNAAAHWFDWLRLAGAAYLVWMGIGKLRHAGEAAPSEEMDGEAGTIATASSDHGPFWQGFLVILSNPKVLVFLAAFLPQFINSRHPLTPQLILLAVTFLILATVIDSLYVLLASRVRRYLTEDNLALIDRISGLILIVGGIWLALLQRG